MKRNKCAIGARNRVGRITRAGNISAFHPYRYPEYPISNRGFKAKVRSTRRESASHFHSRRRRPRALIMPAADAALHSPHRRPNCCFQRTVAPLSSAIYAIYVQLEFFVSPRRTLIHLIFLPFFCARNFCFTFFYPDYIDLCENACSTITIPTQWNNAVAVAAHLAPVLERHSTRSDAVIS